MSEVERRWGRICEVCGEPATQTIEERIPPFNALSKTFQWCGAEECARRIEQFIRKRGMNPVRV